MISSSFYNFWNTDPENAEDNHWVRWLTEQKTNGGLVKLKSVQGTSVHSDPSLSTFTFIAVSAMYWEYFPIGVRTRVSPCTIAIPCTRGKRHFLHRELGAWSTAEKQRLFSHHSNFDLLSNSANVATDRTLYYLQRLQMPVCWTQVGQREGRQGICDGRILEDDPSDPHPMKSFTLWEIQRDQHESFF